MDSNGRSFMVVKLLSALGGISEFYDDDENEGVEHSTQGLNRRYYYTQQLNNLQGD